MAGVSFAYTPNYTFDGSSHDSSYETFNSGEDLYDEFGVDQFGNITGSSFFMHFTSSTTMAAWRAQDRTVQFASSNGSSYGWEGTYDLTSDEETNVSTSYNYIQYSMSDLMTTSNASALADHVASAGAGNTVVNVTLT